MLDLQTGGVGGPRGGLLPPARSLPIGASVRTAFSLGWPLRAECCAWGLEMSTGLKAGGDRIAAAVIPAVDAKVIAKPSCSAI